MQGDKGQAIAIAQHLIPDLAAGNVYVTFFYLYHHLSIIAGIDL